MRNIIKTFIQDLLIAYLLLLGAAISGTGLYYIIKQQNIYCVLLPLIPATFIVAASYIYTIIRTKRNKGGNT